MADISIESLKAGVGTAYDFYISELVLAGPHWERKPTGARRAEDAWCARQVAEHIAGNSGGGGIAKAIGVEGPSASRPELVDAAAAVAATPAAHRQLLAVLDRVQDSHLAQELEFGGMGTMTVANVIGVLMWHFYDHAYQLKALREG